MKKHIRNSVAFFVVFSLLLAFFPADVYCANNPVTISSLTKYITIGKSATISLKNNKEKVSWSLSNNNAKITKKSKTKVTVKALKKGSATLTANIGNKKYQCKIYCANKISKSNIAFSNYYYDHDYYSIIKNNNDIPVDIKAVYNICDKNGSIIDYSTEYIYCLPPKGLYKASWYTDIKNYDKSKSYITYTVEKSEYESMARHIKLSNTSVQKKYDDKYVITTLQNKLNKKIESTCITIVFYKNKKPVYSYKYYEEIDKKEILPEKFYTPYDDDNDKDIPYDDYKISILAY